MKCWGTPKYKSDFVNKNKIKLHRGSTKSLYFLRKGDISLLKLLIRGICHHAYKIYYYITSKNEYFYVNTIIKH